MEVPGFLELWSHVGHLIIRGPHFEPNLLGITPKHGRFLLDQLCNVPIPKYNAIDGLFGRKAGLVHEVDGLVILVAESDAREVLGHGDARPLQHLCAADPRALQDSRGAEGAARHDDQLPGSHGLVLRVFVRIRREAGVRPVRDADRCLIFHHNADNFRLDQYVQVGMAAVAKPRVEIAVGGVLPLTVSRDVAERLLHAVDRIWMCALQVLRLGPTSFLEHA